MKAYDSLAPYYDEFMDFMAYDDEAKALHYLIEDLQAERILDLGAGSGGHLLPLLRNGHKDVYKRQDYYSPPASFINLAPKNVK